MIKVLLASGGNDVNSGMARHLDLAQLPTMAWPAWGVSIAEITKNLDAHEQRRPSNGTIKPMPTSPEFKRIFLRRAARRRGHHRHPAGGAAIAQFAAYALDKKAANTRTRSAPRSRRGRQRR